jgi:hypothetical protein
MKGLDCQLAVVMSVWGQSLPKWGVSATSAFSP